MRNNNPFVTFNINDDIRNEIIKHLPMQDIIRMKQLSLKWKEDVDELIVIEVNKTINNYKREMKKNEDFKYKYATTKQFILEAAKRECLPLFWGTKDADLINNLYWVISKELDEQRAGKESATDFLNQIGPHLQLLDTSSVSKTLNFSKSRIDNVNFHSANLVGVDFIGFKSNRPNFSGANLSWVYLYGSTLIGANFSNANLLEAFLKESTLTGANFSNANLKEAVLIKANLSEANFENADLSRACFFRSNITLDQLSKAKSIIRLELAAQNFHEMPISEHTKDLKNILVRQYKTLIAEEKNINQLKMLIMVARFDNVLTLEKNMIGNYKYNFFTEQTASYKEVYRAAEKRIISIVNEMTNNNVKLDASTWKKLNEFPKQYFYVSPSKSLSGFFAETELQEALNNNKELRVFKKIPTEQEMKEAIKKKEAKNLIFTTLIQIGAFYLPLAEQKKEAEKFIKENILLLNSAELGELKELISKNAGENSPLFYFRESQSFTTMLFGGKTEYRDDAYPYNVIMNELDNAIKREEYSKISKTPGLRLSFNDKDF